MCPNYNEQENRSRISRLVERGVRVWGPERVYIGEDVSLDRIGAGAYEHCVLLSGAKTRGFAELREGTVLEEEAEIAHNVGLKNTVFTIAVVAGSCINYCD